MNPATPMPPDPPLTMRLSSGLLFGAAGLILLDVIVDLVFVNTGLSVYKDTYTGETGSGFASLVGATVGILAGAGISILAIMNNHGSEKARVTTLVLGGLWLVCSGFFGSLSGGFHAPSGSAGGGRLARIMPSAYGILTTLLEALVILAVLGGLVLLVLPPSTRFFHARRPVGYVTLPLYHPTTGQPVLHPQQHATTGHPLAHPQHTPIPPPMSRPPEQAPHSASIPMADPWARPGAQNSYHPRHQDGPPAG